jgi:Serine carboxypeptidase S28
MISSTQLLTPLGVLTCLLTNPALLVFANDHLSAGHPLHLLNPHQRRIEAITRHREADAGSRRSEFDCDLDELWFTQPLDHFNDSDTRTYGQRYFVNWKYYNASATGDNPVVFLMIGGEFPMPRWASMK